MRLPIFFKKWNDTDFSTTAKQVNEALASPPNVPCGPAITVDGDTSEWDLNADFFSNMYKAGNAASTLFGKCYLRYNPARGVLSVLVLQVAPAQYNYRTPADDSYIKIGSSTQVNGTSGNNGVAPDFAFIRPEIIGGKAVAHGYECSFAVPAGNYTGLNIHQQIFDGVESQTAAVPNRSIAFNIINCVSGNGCVIPTLTSVSADTATCTNGITNNNAALHLTGIAGMSKYSYTANDGTGLFALNATPSTSDRIDITGLANPINAMTYTFRLWGADTTCYKDTTIVLPKSVCSPCSIAATFTQGLCNNNGTNATATDDYFTVTVSNVSATNGGINGKYQVVLNGVTVLNTGGTLYGSPVTVGNVTPFLSNGATTYNLTVRDLDQPNCVTTAFTTTLSAGCSTACAPNLCLPILSRRN